MTIAEQYFSAMRERDQATVLALYAKDAQLLLPDGREIRGAAALRKFYEGLLAADSPSPHPLYQFASDMGVATETEITLPDGSKRFTANFFHLDDQGLIARLCIYARA